MYPTKVEDMDREKIQMALALLDPVNEGHRAQDARALLRAALDEVDAIPEPTWRERCAEMFAEAKSLQEHHHAHRERTFGDGVMAMAFASLADACHEALNKANAYTDDHAAGEQIERARRMAYPSEYPAAVQS